MRIKNRTGSPYQLVDKDGNKVMLPAFGEVDIDPHPMHANQYKIVGYFEISESQVEPDDDDDPRDALREEYESLAGEQPDNRWGEGRLQSEIDKLLGQEGV